MFNFTFIHTIDVFTGLMWLNGDRECFTCVQAENMIQAKEFLYRARARNDAHGERVGAILSIRCERVI